MSPRATPVPAADTARRRRQSPAPGAQPHAAILDEAQVQALRNVVDRDPKNAVARAQLGNLYYDAGRYTDAIKWYGESLAHQSRKT